MTDVVKNPRNSDEVFVRCYQKHNGDVTAVARELGVKDNTVKMRALKYISVGIKLVPPQKKSRKLSDRIEKLNSIIS